MGTNKNNCSKLLWGIKPICSNKKAWLRIVEAFLAIMIVLSGMIILLSREKSDSGDSERIYEKQREILSIISKNDSLRGLVIEGKNEELRVFIQKVMPRIYGFNVSTCEIDMICSADTPNDREIFVTESVITSTLEDYSPKKLRFFVWREQN